MTRPEVATRMRAIKQSGTVPELILRRALWRAGVRGYRLNVRRLPGAPDIVFPHRRVAVFVDGAFWHGHPARFNPSKMNTFWRQKVETTVQRDQAVNTLLNASGWTVLRYWDYDILRDPDRSVADIRSALGDRDPLLAEEQATVRQSSS